jgi:type I restriction enzyme S subunit
VSFPSYELYKESGVVRIGRVPSAWQVMHLKRLAALIYGDALPSDERVEDGSVPVFGSNGQFALHDRANTEAPVIFVGRKGSCGALTWSDVPSFGIDTVYFIDDRHVRGNLRWLFWALQTLGLDAMSQDTGVPGLARETAYSTMLPVPSKSEQAAIADFLDRETAKIEALIVEQERLIALLKEKRQAVISHAVTKGLDPNAPMKDSGVEWLGEVPAHWDMKRLKHVSPEITVGIVVNPSQYISDEGLPFLYGGDVSEGHINFDDARRISKDDNDRNSKSQLQTNDLIVVRVGAPGVTAVVPSSCAGGNCASVMLIRRGDFSSDWLCYLMNSKTVRFQVEIVQYGAAQEQFNISHAVNFRLPCPPLEEQQEIGIKLNQEVARLDTLAAAAIKAITLLQERREALISAAVTGKIDVRNLAPAEAEAA